MRKNIRSGLTLVELLVVIAILGVIVGMLLPAVQSAREASRKLSCLNNHKNIVLATLNFQSARGEYPVGVHRVQNQGHLHVKTWAALIAPYLESAGVGVEYSGDNCICSRVNQNALMNPSSVFLCPSMPESSKDVRFEASAHGLPYIFAASTHIHPPGSIGGELNLLVGGGKTLIREEDGNKGQKLVPDGTSNTIIFVETTAPDHFENQRITSREISGGSCFLPGSSFIEENSDFSTNLSANSLKKSHY